MSFNTEHHDNDAWRAAPTNQGGGGVTTVHVDYKALTIQVWLSITALWGAKLFTALMMGASFSVINPILGDVYLGDFIPVPSFAEDITMGAVVNAGLGMATVILPAVLWSHILSDEFQANPRGYFEGQPIRIAIGIILTFTYLTLITLEVLALESRIHSSLDTGPIRMVQEQPEALPLIIASVALILGTILIGLASASLSKSIAKRFGKPVQLHY